MRTLTRGPYSLRNKLPHALIQCEPRQTVNHKVYQYPVVFGENRKYQTNFLCGRFHQSTQAQGVGDIVISFLFFTFPFLLLTFWCSLRHLRKNKNEITLWPPWASVVYITCLKILFIAFVILFRDTVDNCILDFTRRMLYKFSWLPAFWELFLEALAPLLLTLHVAWSKWNHSL